MVTVKLFGTLRLDSGVREFRVQAHCVREIYALGLREIRRIRPESSVTERELRACLVAVNGQQVSPRAVLKDGDEVWLFPAVAGG